MIDWYFVFNQTEFLATGLVSREVSAFFEGIGFKTVLITRGNELSITVDGVMLSVSFLGNNPFTFEDRSVFVDSGGDVYYGIAQ